MHANQPPLIDPVAFSIFYERNHIIIFRFIYGMRGGPVEVVEDLTGDTFFRAWRSRNRFFGDDHDALCWLFTIARRLVIDAHRHAKVQPSDNMISIDEDVIERVEFASQDSPEEIAAEREQIKLLWHILQVLPDEKREMLVLRYMVGWKVKEIAQYMQKEENTVSVYIKRSLEQIRQAWSAG